MIIIKTSALSISTQIINKLIGKCSWIAHKHGMAKFKKIKCYVEFVHFYLHTYYCRRNINAYLSVQAGISAINEVINTGVCVHVCESSLL